MSRFRGRAVVALMLVMEFSSAQAQPSSKIPRIGYMSPDFGPNVLSTALLMALGELGWEEGRNIVIDYRWAQGRPDRYPALAAELVGLKVDLIVAGGGTPGALAAKRATSTISIVTPTTGGPVGAGLVTSLARPGRNVTGLSMQDAELTAKRLELLKGALPKVVRVAVLHDPAAPMERVTATDTAARSLGLTLHVVTARRPEDFDDALAAAKRARADALVVLASPVFNVHRRRLVDLAAKQRLAAIYEHRLFPDAGPDVLRTGPPGAQPAGRCLRGQDP